MDSENADLGLGDSLPPSTSLHGTVARWGMRLRNVIKVYFVISVNR